MKEFPKDRLRDNDPLEPRILNRNLSLPAHKYGRLDGHDFIESNMKANLVVGSGAYYTNTYWLKSSGLDPGVGSPPATFNLPVVGTGQAVSNNGTWQTLTSTGQPQMTVTPGLGVLWINAWLTYIWHLFTANIAGAHYAYSDVFNYALNNTDGANVQFALRVNGEILPGSLTGHEFVSRRSWRAIHADPERLSATDPRPGPQLTKAQRAAGIGPMCMPVRIFGAIPVSPGSYTIELIARRLPVRNQEQAPEGGYRTDDVVEVYNASMLTTEFPTWPGATATPSSVTYSPLANESTLATAAMTTSRANVLRDAYNDIAEGAVARGAFSNEHLPSALLDSSCETIVPTAAEMTDNFYPGVGYPTTTTNQTGDTGWFLLHDGIGAPPKNLSTEADHPGVWDPDTNPSLFLILANINITRISPEGGGDEDNPSAFGAFGIGQMLTGAANPTVLTRTHCYANNWRIMAVTGGSKLEHMDIALMAVIDARTTPIGTTYDYFGVYASGFQPTGVRSEVYWQFGSLQVLQFRDG